MKISATFHLLSHLPVCALLNYGSENCAVNSAPWLTFTSDFPGLTHKLLNTDLSKSKNQTESHPKARLPVTQRKATVTVTEKGRGPLAPPAEG